jgi:hypothetical protein
MGRREKGEKQDEKGMFAVGVYSGGFVFLPDECRCS